MASLSRVYRIFGSTLFCLQILVCAHPAAAQANVPTAGPVQPAAEPPIPSGANRRVSIDVAVADKKGMPVPGLAQQDFTLLDNKKPASILSFQAFGSAQTPARPDEVILVVDAVNLEFRYVAYARQALDTFFRQNEGHLAEPVSIFVTTDRGVSGLSTPSTDGNALAAAFDGFQNGLRMIGNAAGAWGASERFQLSLQMFMNVVQNTAKHPGRKLIIWIGPGWPLLDGPAFNSLSAREERQLFGAIVQISTALRQNHITLDSISAGFPNSFTFLYQSFLKGVKSPNQAVPSDLAEKVIAVQSGGIALPPRFDLPGDIQRCIDGASVFYRLSFDAPPAEKPDQYHSLEVKIDRANLKAFTSTGYYDQP